MTEEEAKTKWCPFARVTDRRESGCYNRLPMTDFSTPDSARCIGSACMAWRSIEVHDDRERHLYSKKTGQRVSGGRNDETEWRLANPDEPAPVPQGFCGLAGKP